MKQEISAGGVVLRQVSTLSSTRRAQDKFTKSPKWEVLIVQHSGHHRWVLPKGWIDSGETKEQTAVREVKEEAGVEAEIQEYLGEVTIWYQKEGEKIRKTSHYFLMKYLSGDPAKDHGWEMEDTAWLPAEEAIKKLDYPGEKKMVEKATALLNKS